MLFRSLNMVLEQGLDALDSSRLYEMLQFANAAASIITTRKGALKVMPDKQDVLDLIQKMMAVCITEKQIGI